MRVLITGGTGFVGSHTVAAVLSAGHEVRLLVRSPERARRVLARLGVDEGDVELVTGDVTDAEAVRRALDGCDAVIHAAAIFSLDPRRAAEINRTNVAATEIVLGRAADAGLDPIVYVSAVAAMFGHRGVITADLEPGTPDSAYMRSKAEADRVARRIQSHGAPVVITYPSFVLGPDDPTVGESSHVPIQAVRGRYRVSPRGAGMVVTDVRDLAQLHAAVLEAGRGPRRYIAPATALPLPDALERFSSLTGRTLRTTAVPPRLTIGMARVLDLAQRLLPLRMPADSHSVRSAIAWGRIDGVDDSPVRSELGIEGRDINETLRDTLAWLHREGHISPKQAGRLAAA